MCRGIFGTQISFHLNNASGQQPAPIAPNQYLAQQIRPHQSRIAVIKGSAQNRGSEDGHLQ
jgi:hypothetical protein